MNIYTTPTHDEFFKYAQQHSSTDGLIGLKNFGKK